MFCYQCEQTVKGTGCESFGVCGKDPQTSDIQDLLIYQLRGISQLVHKAYEYADNNPEIDRFLIKGLFTTVTNVNFDPHTIGDILRKGNTLLKKAFEMCKDNCHHDEKQCDAIGIFKEHTIPDDYDKMLEFASDHTFDKDIEKLGDETAGLYHLIIYGLKGTASYVDHAMILGIEDNDVYRKFHELMAFTADPNHNNDELLKAVLDVGELNLRAMEMLDKANTGTYGHPEPTEVRISSVKGKCILVSGHDLKDLKILLEETENKGINIYTHGEMLPANAYPELKKHKHFIGNYGGAWQDQAKEFDAFPGAILMTTNCIQKPRKTYINRIFTTGLVQWPNVVHVSNSDFSPVIEAALNADGFTEDEEEKHILIGFARNAVISVADKVINLVKQGKIKHFFLIGGCDGAKPGRNYYTEFAEKVPNDSVILTLACGKYRFNKKEFNDIDGIPRLLDVGQCNDAYSAIMIAMALAEAFETDINSLPLSMILSWYEQKAVCILLTLLYLNVKNIRLGPTLPAFIKPAVLEILSEKFNLMPTTTPDEDLKAILGKE